MIEVTVMLPNRGSVCSGKFEREPLLADEAIPIKMHIDDVGTCFLTAAEAATLGQLLLRGYEAAMKDKLVTAQPKLVVAQ